MYDIWKKQAMNELEMYEARKLAVENIPDQLRQLESALSSIRNPGADSVCARTGGGQDDRYLNNITSRELLKDNLKQASKAARRTEKALGVLSEEERLVLDRFYIHPEKKAADRLAGDLHVDVKTVYSRRNAALRKFTVAMFGKV